MALVSFKLAAARAMKRLEVAYRVDEAPPAFCILHGEDEPIPKGCDPRYVVRHVEVNACNREHDPVSPPPRLVDGQDLGDCFSQQPEKEDYKL